jgi:hypothetical protein
MGDANPHKRFPAFRGQTRKPDAVQGCDRAFPVEFRLVQFLVYVFDVFKFVKVSPKCSHWVFDRVRTWFVYSNEVRRMKKFSLFFAQAMQNNRAEKSIADMKPVLR